MFGFFKRQPKQATPSSPEDYQGEFRRLTQALYDKFALGDTPYDLLLDAMFLTPWQLAPVADLCVGLMGNWHGEKNEPNDLILLSA